ncbi:E3 ubiquitin-protein ligase RNF25 [Topomyia yanbarensis]|uniref:E3 ubiquitin-protein ligase RNF25 n=1 Tax=Topomyia yanbarensis TaxID=2498891 RepID=UPI00273AA285|nr:E3 ubiquitin-protein ligase RNF25 [Topomyia yanbarensis]
MDALIDEVESLEAILMEDVAITRNDSGFPELIETTVFPTVGGELDSQYVCITLQVLPVPGYPDVKPTIKLKNPRGLDDHIINSIETAVHQKLDECLGQPVVFDLIDIIREQLTESNVPSGQCVICLYGFQEGDEFTKTACYHYLHSHCLACHLKASKRNYEEELAKMPTWKQKEAKPYQALCPVCREPIDVEVEPLVKCQPPVELVNAPRFRLTDELKSLQAQMTRLYLHQKSRGGIIDLDAEEGNVIAIETENVNNESSKNTHNVVHASTTLEGATVLSVPQLPKQQGVFSGGSHHHERGNSSRHSGPGSGGNRHNHNHNNRSVRTRNGSATVGVNITGDAGVVESPLPPPHSYHHHRGGHRHRRSNHHHHHGGSGGHHHRGTATTGGSSAAAAQNNLNSPCGSGAR